MLLQGLGTNAIRKRKVKSVNRALQLAQAPLTERVSENAPPQQYGNMTLRRLGSQRANSPKRLTAKFQSKYNQWMQQPPSKVCLSNMVNTERLWTVDDCETYNFVSSRHTLRLKAAIPKQRPCSRSARILDSLGSFEVKGWQNDFPE